MKTVWRREIGHNDLIMRNNTTPSCLKLPFRDQFAIPFKHTIIVRNAYSMSTL